MKTSMQIELTRMRPENLVLITAGGNSARDRRRHLPHPVSLTPFNLDCSYFGGSCILVCFFVYLVEHQVSVDVSCLLLCHIGL